VLRRLQTKSDADSVRKFKLLAPLVDKDVPNEPDYKDKSLSSKLYRAGQAVKGFARDQFTSLLGEGTAGEEVDRSSGKPVITRAGRAETQADVALRGIQGRTLMAGGAGKTFVSTAGKNAAVGAGYNTAESLKSSNTQDKTVGQVAKGTAKSAAEGAAFGGAAGIVGKGLSVAVNARKIVGKAAKTDSQFQASLQQAARDLGTTVQASPAKGINRVTEKGIKDYKGDLSEVKDAVRGTIVLKDPSKVDEVVTALRQRYNVTRVKNTLDRPGYGDVKVNVALSKGQTGEIILATPEMIAAKASGGHKLYKQARTMKEGPERSRLEQELTKIYEEASSSTQRRLNKGLDSNLESQTGAPVSTKSLNVIVDTDITTPKHTVTQKGPIGQDIGQDVLPNESRFDPSSRLKQYDESLQATMKNIEQDPAYLERLKEQGGGRVISNRETYAKARELGPMDEAEIIGAKAGDKIDAVNVVRAKATVDTAAKEFTDFWESKEWTPAQLQERIERLSKLEAGYHVISAEPGRATQIQNSFIDEAFRRAQKLKELLEGTKGPKADELIEKELADFDKAVAKAGGVYEPGTLQRVRSWIEEYATAAKLTSPLTHAINLGSNLLTAPVRVAENIVSTGIGTIQGKTTLAQLKHVFGTYQGFKAATKQLVADLKQAVDVKAPDLKPDGTKMENAAAIPGKAGKAIRTPFNLLQASDNFMKALLRDSELHMRGYEKAFQEGFKGRELARRVAELVDNPTPELIARAEKVAKEFTYTSDPGPITKKIASLVNTIPGGRLLVPFISTPTNIAKFQIQRHPLGLFTPTNINALRKGTNLDRREAVARLTVGTGLAVGGLMAAFGAKENITGPAPTNKGEKDVFYSSGKKPYAIKIGNRWVAYNRFSPIGSYLTQAVGLRDKMIENERKSIKKGVEVDELGSLLVAFGTATAKGMTDLPFVQGVSSVIELLGDPSEFNANRVVGGVLTGLIPNIGRDIASAGDEFARDARSIGDQVKQMIPGLRNKTSERMDIFGEPQRQSGGPAERGFLKITSTDKSDRLTQALEDAAFFPSPPSEKQRNVTLTAAEYKRFRVESGKRFRSKLEAAIGDAAYRDLPRDRKSKTLEAALSDARSDILDDILGEPAKSSSPRVKRY